MTRRRGPNRTGGTARPTPLASSFRLRRARLADLPTLLTHRQKMWEDIGGWSRAEVRRSLPAYRKWAHAQWSRGKFLAFVAVDAKGRALGSGAIWLVPTHPRVQPFTRELPYLLSMYTEPKARRQGVATAIVRACIDWARHHRYPRIVLHASSMGMPVYERLGFEMGREMRLDLAAKQPTLLPSRRRTTRSRVTRLRSANR